ncbi:MAG: hydantoinase/oxoprolinase family protein [Acidimicrobiia bacterium]
MGLVVSVDVGGTFTDAFVASDDRSTTGKSRTTHHDLSVGFIGALEQASRNLGRELADVLQQADRIVYSTTVGMNALVERTGPRVGLITTRGQEETLHLGRSRSWADGMPDAVQMDRTRARRPPDLVPRALRVGVRERVDCFGNIVMPLVQEDVIDKVDYLADKGVRAFAVCLSWSFMNPEHEVQVRDTIRSRYPEVYLGRAHVLLSSEVAPQIDEYRRSTTTVLTAFLSTLTEDHLLDLTDRLRELGYRRPLLLARNIGGVASPSRTTALHLLGAGAVAALAGAGQKAREFGMPNVVAADMGGTTFDIGFILEGRERTYEFEPIVDRWRIHLPVIANASIGAGGGSIASLTSEGTLQVGPKSAGSIPGPACYDTGGTEPTVTDADLVLGFLDPEFFLGGRFPLNRMKAERAIKRRIAEPLNIDVEEAALRIRRIVDGVMGQEIYKQTALKGHDPREFVMFALGGAGPVHACHIAEAADIFDVVTFPYAPEFNAFGGSVMEVVQSYEKTHRILVFDPLTGTWFDDLEAFNGTVEGLLDFARRDLAEEGFSIDDVRFSLELDMNYVGQQHTVRHVAHSLYLTSGNDVRRIGEEFNNTFAGVYGRGATNPEGGIEVQLFKLTASASLESSERKNLHFRHAERRGQTNQKRICFWPGVGAVATPVYLRSDVPPETALMGPVLIEDVDTVVAVAPGWTYESDSAFVGRLRRSR